MKQSMITPRFVTLLLVLGMMVMPILSSMKVMADDLSPLEELGKILFFDNISSPDWMSCATCHSPDTGWTGPNAVINNHGAVYNGAISTRFGNRKPPSAAYATLSPVFHFNSEEGIFVGGNFWDGRATGENLGNPAADQALGPFLNPVEQNNASKLAVCEQVASSEYAVLFEEVWGAGALNCSVTAEKMYDQVGLSIAAYENSSEVNQYSSKYDAFLAGDAELSDEEARGLNLFAGKGLCAECHPTGVASPFTDFTYDNLGVPRNPENPFYDMDKELLNNGKPINSEGQDWIDPGLGGFLKTRGESSERIAENMGKHRVPTLRNVAKGPARAFMHNGYFKSLKGIVHFYNTRDTKSKCSNPLTSERDALKMNCWPAGEVSENINTEELGNLGLTDAEEGAIVAFMKTLSDGFKVNKKGKKEVK